MHVVQVGYYAWLSTHAGATCVTSSGAHAARFADQGAAHGALAAFTGDRGPALANTCGTPRLLAYLRTAPVTLVPAAEFDARMARCNGRHGDTASPVVARVTRPTPVAENPAEPRPAGVTKQVYQWVLDHPQATKADARAAFPSANPTTVGVQFGLARKAVA